MQRNMKSAKREMMRKVRNRRFIAGSKTSRVRREVARQLRSTERAYTKATCKSIVALMDEVDIMPTRALKMRAAIQYSN